MIQNGNNMNKDNIGHNENNTDFGFIISDKNYYRKNILILKTETKVHIDLWLNDPNQEKKGDHPSGVKEVEIILKSFKFE